MNLAKFSVKHSLLVNIISVFIFLVGIDAVFRIPLDMFPPVDFDIVTIKTSYPGATPEDVEKFVTIPIEKQLKGISGIKELESTSTEGQSLIGITIDPEIEDKDSVVDDIKDAVERVRNLPASIEEDPVVFELKSKESPVLEVSVSGEFPESEKREYAKALENYLTDIDGIASVRRIGWRDQEYWVEVFPNKLQEYHVSVDEIIDALQTRNVSIPGGELTSNSVEFNIRVTGEFTSVEEISDVVIRANDSGNWLKVKDVARVVNTFEDENRIAKINGKRAVAMIVIKSEYGDVVRLAEEVKETIEEFKKRVPRGMEITITNDFSYYVKRRLGVLKNNGFIGFFLVLGILIMFLSFTPALVTAFGIPIAFFMTFIVMNYIGVSINLVSMLGLIIVLGMLVDDGIIVSENIYRYIEMGMEPKEAAIKGTQEVIAPVTVTILTTCAAFGPLLFMSDIMGKFIRQVPLVVMIALAASLLEAFVFLPAHMADMVTFMRHFNKKDLTKNNRQIWFKKIVDAYTRVLTKSLNYRYIVVFAILIPLFVGSIFLLKTKVKFVLFPDEGIEQFFVRAEAKKGTPLSELNELIVPVEEIISQIPEKYVDSYRTYLGSIEEERGFDPNAKQGSHLGQITVFLSPFQTRDKNAHEISRLVSEQLKNVAGFEKIYVVKHKAGPPVGRDISISIKGENINDLEVISQKYIKFLEGIEGVSDIESSYVHGKKQLKVVVDEEKAKQYYISIGQIAKTVRAAFNGVVATRVNPLVAEEEIDVLVRFAKEDRKSMNSFDKIYVRNQKDKLVPLNTVAHIEEDDGVYSINHQDGKKVINVTASVDNDVMTSIEVNQTLVKKFENIEKDYLGVVIKYGGEFEKQMESRKNMTISFIFALGIIFIILTAMFNSLLQPFIVMMAIPFGIIGVIIAFYLHGKPFNFFALMGIVGLTGVVVNDSIVLVDFINRLRIKGKDRRHSLIEAGQIRLRPVIMTTVTTIGGLVAVAYGIGGGDPFLKSLALAIIWGLAFATILTLIVIPCIYAIVDDLTEKILHKSLVKGEKEIPEINGVF